MTILTFRYIQCLHLMYAEVAWALVSSGAQVQPQIILSPDYLPDYLSVSYDYGSTNPITSIFFFFSFFTCHRHNSKHLFATGCLSFSLVQRNRGIPPPNIKRIIDLTIRSQCNNPLGQIFLYCCIFSERRMSNVIFLFVIIFLMIYTPHA